ncbi:hypothetical protein MUK70_18940 [Dyadobacter chenwenxiniae]|uniref:Uncharacterized protein n=1 Tax=Dyadobacter chenwenxiniae TaxID=2906456 RepID=A0A9X1TDU4_9BACT|nr:hypothetical protein [Dyadobacter chenwenxiniae]MCF0061317.1 hypothetical protein [Dyadobacter chenwenxiniae]UON81139.1 hypothetical protein MUK70_18940 [Dyadobacter chenwenxiniae]
MDKNQEPSEKALEEAARRGLSPDKDDNNTLRDDKGRNGGKVEGDWIWDGYSWKRVY